MLRRVRRSCYVVWPSFGAACYMLTLAGFAAAIAPLAERTGAANPFDGVSVAFISAPSFADLDGDGDLDAVVGEIAPAPCDYFENTGSATAPAFTERDDAANPFSDIDVGSYSPPLPSPISTATATSTLLTGQKMTSGLSRAWQNVRATAASPSCTAAPIRSPA